MGRIFFWNLERGSALLFPQRFFLRFSEPEKKHPLTHWENNNIVVDHWENIFIFVFLQICLSHYAKCNILPKFMHLVILTHFVIFVNINNLVNLVNVDNLVNVTHSKKYRKRQIALFMKFIVCDICK